MVNPYQNRAASHGTEIKSQILLGQSNALKKFEKFQNKYDPNQTSVERKNIKKKEILEKKKSRHVLDTTDEEDKIDTDDEESFFENNNKFMKKKLPTTEFSVKKQLSDSDEKSDIEISILDQQQQKQAKIPFQQKPIINRSNNSSATSVRSVTGTQRRSQSKVKFVNESSENEESEDDSTRIEDLLSKNLILDIDELTASHSVKFQRNRRITQSPLAMAAHKRSESVTSIQEESINEENLRDSEASSLLIDHNNLILDINELEKSISKMEKKEKKARHKERKRFDSENSERSFMARNIKKEKKKKNTTSEISTFLDKTDSSIATESIPDIDDDDDDDETKTINSDITTRIKNRSSKKNVTKSYMSDEFETHETTTTTKKTKSSRHKKSRNSARTPRTQQSYMDDFETTDFDVDVTPRHKKQLSFFNTTEFVPEKQDRQKVFVETTTASCQVDPQDLLKNSSLLNTVNVYNPSSILLATTSHLNSGATLKDLNQVTGYCMINQAFNEILKVNINFVQNFLGAQRALYEQQISSIKPKPRDY